MSGVFGSYEGSDYGPADVYGGDDEEYVGGSLILGAAEIWDGDDEDSDNEDPYGGEEDEEVSYNTEKKGAGIIDKLKDMKVMKDNIGIGNGASKIIRDLGEKASDGLNHLKESVGDGGFESFVDYGGGTQGGDEEYDGGRLDGFTGGCGCDINQGGVVGYGENTKGSKSSRDSREKDAKLNALIKRLERILDELRECANA